MTVFRARIPGTNNWIVSAEDYDALAARLAEAERLLTRAEKVLGEGSTVDDIRDFLRAADSAREKP